MDLDLNDDEFPEECYCPITQVLFEDPVITADGHTYERKFIEAWFAQGKDTSPMTNLKLDSFSLIPNLALKRLIASSKQKAERVKKERANNNQKDLNKVAQQLGKMWESNIITSGDSYMKNKDKISRGLLKEEQVTCFQCERVKILDEMNKDLGICLMCIKQQRKIEENIHNAQKKKKGMKEEVQVKIIGQNAKEQWIPQFCTYLIEKGHEHTAQTIMKTPFNEIKKIILFDRQLGNQGLKFFQFARLKSLNCLDLCSNHLTSKGISFLVQAKFENLRDVNLNNNQIGSQGIKQLTLADWPRLQKLFLNHNSINDDALILLNSANFPFLKKLYLCDNFITYKGVKIFLENLTMGKIEEIYFLRNQIQNEEKQFFNSQRNSVGRRITFHI